jgi:hypothetical protein
MLLHLSSRSAYLRADQKGRMMTNTKKKGIVSTRARGNTNVSAISTMVARLPHSSLGMLTYSAGPEKPSRRMRQKWTAMKRLAISGMKMQWRM